MPYRTTDLRTAINRAALFMSVGTNAGCTVFSHRESRAYMVVDNEILDHIWHNLAEAGYTLAIDLLPDEIMQLTGPVQLSLLEDDVYAISQKDI
jgi:hypothetical protein